MHMGTSDDDSSEDDHDGAHFLSPRLNEAEGEGSISKA